MATKLISKYFTYFIFFHWKYVGPDLNTLLIQKFKSSTANIATVIGRDNHPESKSWNGVNSFLASQPLPSSCFQLEHGAVGPLGQLHGPHHLCQHRRSRSEQRRSSCQCGSELQIRKESRPSHHQVCHIAPGGRWWHPRLESGERTKFEGKKKELISNLREYFWNKCLPLFCVSSGSRCFEREAETANLWHHQRVGRDRAHREAEQELDTVEVSRRRWDCPMAV